MTRFIDLRSDTVTRPTEAMRRAMAAAEVGDDVLGDDPTVRRLEERVAGMLGKPAACFVPTGTMANACALRIQTRPGDEIICHRESHIYLYEAGGYAALCGCSIRLLDGERGQFGPEAIEPNVRWDDPHEPRSRVVAVENTHNRGGGSVWPIGALEAVGREAHRLGLRAHLDGARIWNAHVTSGVSLARIAAPFDTVSCCFSKGLGAPVGSMLCATEELIARARRIRKLLGGAMRQSGVLAAAAVHALDHHLPRLAEDHVRARRLAETLDAAPAISAPAPETNLVYFQLGPDLPPAQEACRQLGELGIGLLPEGARTLRAVCHLDVQMADVDAAGAAIVNWARGA
jgi:threonine aldolase